jgi:hypothetical protein
MLCNNSGKARIIAPRLYGMMPIGVGMLNALVKCVVLFFELG